MVKHLEEAVNNASNLPNSFQEELANIIENYVNEKKWDEVFVSSESQSFLEKMENRILANLEVNKCEKMDLDKL